MAILQSELNLLQELSEVPSESTDKEGKVAVLFSILDPTGAGKLGKSAVAAGLERMRGDETFSKKAARAAKLVREDKTSADKEFMTAEEFEKLVPLLHITMDCTLDELADILVLQVSFSDKHDSMVPVHVRMEEDKIETNGDANNTGKPRDTTLRGAMKDIRMKALFDVFDEHGTGVVDFQELVVGLYKAMDGIEEASHAAVEALLLFDNTPESDKTKPRRELMYHEFAKLMLNLASLQGLKSFDDIADTMTRNAINISSGVTAEYVLEKFSMDKESKVLLDISNDDEFVNLGVVELAKIDRLFKMFDEGHDDKIDAKELTLGLAKFHATTGMDQTAEESAQVMKAFDLNHDGKLGHHEFSSFIVNFASRAGMELLDLMDFMIVVMALKDNTAAQEEYVSQIRRSTTAERVLDIRYG